MSGMEKSYTLTLSQLRHLRVNAIDFVKKMSEIFNRATYTALLTFPEEFETLVAFTEFECASMGTPLSGLKFTWNPETLYTPEVIQRLNALDEAIERAKPKSLVEEVRNLVASLKSRISIMHKTDEYREVLDKIRSCLQCALDENSKDVCGPDADGKLQVGDICYLNSGSPPLTVTAIYPSKDGHPDMIAVQWLSRESQVAASTVRSGDFPRPCLRRTDPSLAK